MKLDNSLGRALIANLESLEEKMVALEGSTGNESQIMIPIPNYLIQQKDPAVTQFIRCIGAINHNKELGLPISLEQGAEVRLNNGESSRIIECVFTYSSKTNVEKVKEFLYNNL